MSEINNAIFNNKQAIPNKLLQSDGTITDLAGNPVVNATEVYNAKSAIPNKFLNPDGTYSTLEEILGGSIGADIFEVVDELPETGEPNKIYLVSNGEGGFIEYYYVDGKWDIIGALDVGVSPQVFYWDGKTDQDGLAFWNNVYQLQKTTPCIVIKKAADAVRRAPYVGIQ